MASAEKRGGLFAALLKYWRGERAMSQLDLALAAGVSARHVSFLETGRAQPSQEMVLALGATLDIPMREQNALLRAAGFDDVFEEPRVESGLEPPIAHAIERMMAQHEPFPMAVLDRGYDVVRINRGAQRLIGRFIADPAALRPPLNAFRLLFDPRLARPFVADWERTARTLLSRLHREALHARGDHVLTALLEDLLAYPDVPAGWRHADFSVTVPAVFPLRIERDGVCLSFLTTLTTFNAPHNITLEELRIESYFPLDDATEAACRAAAGGQT